MSDPIAEFLAKGGTIRKLPEGAKALNITDRQWGRLVRHEDAGHISDIVEADECAYEREAEVFGAARAGGASQDQAMQELNDFRFARAKGRAR